MADIFTKSDARRIFERKTLWLFGDSNMRGLYKDIIWLLQKNSLIHLNCLKGKLEGSYLNDNLIKGGILHRGRQYQEIRRYKDPDIDFKMEFTFLTQCMCNDIQMKLKSITEVEEIPDVIVLNSCLWDITRMSDLKPMDLALVLQLFQLQYNEQIVFSFYWWGPDGVEKYKKNILDLMKLLKSVLPHQTRVVWLTTPPVSNDPRGGFFIRQINFLKHTLRFEVMEANFFVSREVILHGFDVVDVHYHLLLQIHRRQPDGIHWSPEAMRHMTNLLLTHLCICWGYSLPQNFKSPVLKKLLDSSDAPPCERETQPAGPLKFAADAANTSKNLPPQNVKSPKKRGTKRKRKRKSRDRNYCDDFTRDVFEYDYKRKRFKLGKYC